MSGLDSDPGALSLARRLSAADFSVESRVRERLRARLLSPRTRRAPAARALVGWALAALVLGVPLGTRMRRPPAYPRGEHGLPVLPGRLGSAEPARPEPVFEVHPNQDLFERRRTSLTELFGAPVLAEEAKGGKT